MCCLIPDAAALTIASRFAAGFVMIVLFEVQFRSNVRTQWLHITCAFALIVCYLAWLCPALTTTQTTPLSYYLVFGAIFMMGANLFFSFQFMLSIVTSSIVLGIFFVALYFFPSSDAYRVALGTFYVSCFTFTSYVNWKLNKERYHVFLNAQEARNQHHEATERGKALLRLSRTDPLTGLENRRAIDEKLREHWSDWQLLGKSFAAILIDVDFFKKFNDFYGHQEGDRCLVLVANALSAIIDQKLGSLGRYGGEEFIVLVRVDRAEEVVELAEIIRRTVEQLELSHEPRRDGVSVVTVSVGAAITRVQTGAKLEKVIHEADRALYLAKASGRNCIRLFDPNDPQSSDVNENIAALLKIAVANNLVSMVYQPIQDLKSGRVEAVEGLMRLKMLDGTAVPPSLFIPVAERTGAIQELGRWAIRRVCDELLADNSIGIVSVNVSPTQLKALGFASNVATMLAETGVPGSRLAFEITEGLELEMHSDVLRCISDLKRLGIRIWLDDFGTGFRRALLVAAHRLRYCEDRSLFPSRLHHAARRGDVARHHRPGPQSRSQNPRGGCRDPRTIGPHARIRDRSRAGLFRWTAGACQNPPIRPNREQAIGFGSPNRVRRQARSEQFPATWTEHDAGADRRGMRGRYLDLHMRRLGCGAVEPELDMTRARDPAHRRHRARHAA